MTSFDYNSVPWWWRWWRGWRWWWRWWWGCRGTQFPTIPTNHALWYNPVTAQNLVAACRIIAANFSSSDIPISSCIAWLSEINLKVRQNQKSEWPIFFQSRFRTRTNRCRVCYCFYHATYVCALNTLKVTFSPIWPGVDILTIHCQILSILGRVSLLVSDNLSWLIILHILRFLSWLNLLCGSCRSVLTIIHCWNIF